ncbi:hypothetical protein Curi_c19070 [Gottschalkia acidurici 9a]|uniref:Sigma factor regulator C-terminal domain-containing protein n=1 Tax=Gottschalkia acidurici (strain ATCC 7906 / DSM 604 / BCRC 14475 / CIP 104303 / KCTC 5404 / NCIMB 10678 / 9a) TaxID=1128398 RepID=K0B1H6_GOTA9|nr:anti sigma factor C-terminal domain-containing protein [Gottschalkia acidurici]AFS78912.1 hypothetical protein Curi_c19070 [Gottschalkia acidurici 9a]
MTDKKNDIYIDDEKELDEIFDEVKSNKISKAIKNAKRFSTLKIVFISFFTFVVLSFLSISIGEKVIYKKWNNYISNVENTFLIQYPNSFPGTFYTYKGFFSRETEYKTFKLINGKRVYTGSDGIKFDLLGKKYIQADGRLISSTEMTAEDLNFLPRYNYLGQKLMAFYYPYVDYEDRYSNDLNLLDDIESSKYIELALSFDKQYTIDQVNDMIPSDINLTWYWIDAVDDKSKENQKRYVNKQEDGQLVEQFPDLCYEDQAYGIKTINEYGEKLKNPEQRFIEALKQHDKSQIYDIIAGKDNEVTKDDIKVQGIVVTGNSENLKLLKNMSFIKASSLGIVVDKY